MPDRGWVHNPGLRRWELLDRHCEPAGWVTDAFLDRATPGQVGELTARARWPDLVPGSPWWQMVLIGGLMDGHREFLDPREYDALPDLVAFDERQQLRVTAPAATRAALAGTGWAVYRRQIQGCGHGPACPYPYRLDRGLW